MPKLTQANEDRQAEFPHLLTPVEPPGYESSLSHFKPCLFDSDCGEPVAWGFEITQYLGEDRFWALSSFGTLECSYPKWFLIIKTLTRAEAIEKYGTITAEEYGTRGGWRSVTFGNRRFLSKKLRG